jgi:hypothetical protein
VNGATPEIFRSFWWAGFESACHINGAAQRLDMIGATEHDARAAEDFALVGGAGIRTVREGMRWHLIDRGGRYDFSSALGVARAAKQAGMQVIWNLCHYGWPDDINLFAPAFVERFARYCGAVARFVADLQEEIPVYSPINEISFFSWAAGEAGYIYPHARGAGGRVKAQLVRAAIAGMEAIRDVDSRARFLHADPLIHVVPPRDRPDLARAAADCREAQFEAWDMLAGGFRPELGGQPRYLDIVAGNFYHANEWEYPERRLGWDAGPADPRWQPLSRLLIDLHHRYGRPMAIGETSHFGAGRPSWIREVAREVRLVRATGVPLLGVCLYPIIDRPDWDDAGHWHRSGLWDCIPGPRGLSRVLCEEYAEAFTAAREGLP